jgi:superfamily II DNA or RNA helicase
MIRAYQDECVTAFATEFERGTTATLGVLATGLGKTTIASEFIRRIQPARSLFLAHRDTLIYQARDTIERIAKVKCGIEMAELKADYGFFSKEQVVIGTVQTQYSGNSGAGRMALFRPTDFDYLFLDEAHHWVAPAYLKVVRYFQQNPRLKIVGFTATADRFDKESLGQLFQTTAYKMDILAGINEGWLVPIYQQYVPVQGLDYSHIKTTAGDLNLGQLSAVLEEEETVQRMIQPTIEAAWNLPDRRLDYAPVEEWGNVLGKKGRPKRTLVFCSSIKQAQRFAEVLNRVRSGMACAIWDKVSREERKIILGDFKTGKLQILVNVGICGEGFDNPAVEVLVMGRATKSRSLYTQFGGRGLRPADSVAHKLNDCATAEERCQLIASSEKPRCIILDFVGNAGTHKLITAADILGGKISSKGIEKAKKKMLKTTDPMNVMDVLEHSEEEVRKNMERAKKLAEERRIKLVARSHFTKVDIDPFDALDLKPTAPRSLDAGKKLSEKQVALMSRFGIQASRYPYTQAKQLFIELCKRLNDRKATPPQVAVLRRAGYENAAELPQKEAKRLIDNLRNNGWKRPPEPSKIADELF